MSQDSSPNGLSMTQKPIVARIGRWPLYAALTALFFLVAVLIYSVSFVHDPDRKKKEDAAAVQVNEGEKPIWTAEGSGLAIEPEAETSGVIAPPEEKPAEPLIVVQREERPDPNLEHMRRMSQIKTQAYMDALNAPLLARRTDAAREAGTAPGPSTVSASAPVSELPTQPILPESYDPAADRDKEAFFDRAHKSDAWALNEERTAGKPFELKTGAVIPGVMLTGINSDLPGNMIAQVAQNVFDSATGRHLLIPKGSRLYGVYDSRVIYGQERVLIAWNRIIFPDGSSITLGAMPGSDMGGMAGFRDKTNNHYLRIFGSAILMSLISGGMAYAMDSANNSGGESENGTSMQDEMTTALAAQLGQAATTLLQKNLNIKPTLEIRSGYRFNIVVTKDVSFKQAYQSWRR